MRRSLCLSLVLITSAVLSSAQVKSVAQYIEQVQATTNRADVKAANDYIDRNHDAILREWIAITEINAPSGHEQERARYIETLLHKYHRSVASAKVWKSRDTLSGPEGITFK